MGTLSGGLLSGFLYDGRMGTASAQPITQPPSAMRSPNGRWALTSRNIITGGFIVGTDLWITDTRTGAERILYSPPPSLGQPMAQPNMNINAYAYERTERVGSWSPDERYLTIWEIGMVSNSMDADGRPFDVIEVATGAITPLGYTLYQNAWRAPHTLAYVAGGGRETWLNKTIRVWTPEAGLRDVTGPGEVGLAPAWAPDGRLWFIQGPSGQYDPPTFFAGRGIGDRSIVAIELSTNARTQFPRAAGYADEGVRVADDGRTVLVLRRRLDPAAVAGRSPDSWVEIWSAKLDGTVPRPLVRVSGYGGFGYYGAFSSLARIEWVR